MTSTKVNAKTKPDYPIKPFKNVKAWESWLEKNHAKAPGVWIKFAKKDSGIESTNYAEALQVALCYGWIDGQSKSINETWYMQKFTPRGPKSIWSKRNCEFVEALIKEGKMKPAGLATIEAAKADGRWDMAYDSPKNMEMPADFLKELKKHKQASAFFSTLNKTNLYSIAWRLQTAKKTETRMRRMEKILKMLESGETF